MFLGANTLALDGISTTSQYKRPTLLGCIPNDRPEAKVTKTSLLVVILLDYAASSPLTLHHHQLEGTHTRLQRTLVSS